MRTEAWFYMVDGESTLVEFEGSYTFHELAEVLKGDGKWLVFPPTKYHKDFVLIREDKVTHITLETFNE